MLLDEWHLQVVTASAVAADDVETIATIVNTALEPFGAQLQAALRSATGIASLNVVVSQ
jgi:hypothetical protein